MAMVKPAEMTDGQVHQRIQAFIRHLGISNNEFAKQIGDSSAKISQVTSPGGKNPDFRISLLVKILARYPALRTDWLLTGDGPMLKSLAESALPTEGSLGAPRPPEAGWRLALETERAAHQTIPLVEQKAYASYLAGYADPGYLTSRPYIYYPELKGLGPLVAIRVQGESMSPTILPDDVLLCSYQEPGDRVKPGGVYVVCSREGVAVKRVVPRPAGLLCLSDNPDYPPFEVTLAEVAHLWRVRRRVTAFLEATAHIDDRLQTVEQQLAELKERLG